MDTSADNDPMMASYILRTAALLVAFAVAGTGILAATESVTHETIAENERKAVVRTIDALVPVTSRDNDVFADRITIVAPESLGTDKPQTVYRARRMGEPVAVVMESVAPDGYSGAIRLLLAITADGTLAGVRVVSHRETPGLGDYIEEEKSNWILSFLGLSLSNPTRSGWRVKKDGGVFDQVSGATITPRAVVKAVHKTLQYFSQHKEQIFEQPANTALATKAAP